MHSYLSSTMAPLVSKTQKIVCVCVCVYSAPSLHMLTIPLHVVYKGFTAPHGRNVSSRRQIGARETVLSQIWQQRREERLPIGSRSHRNKTSGLPRTPGQRSNSNNYGMQNISPPPPPPPLNGIFLLISAYSCRLK